MKQWNSYVEKFAQLSKREQYIVFFAGVFLLVYVPYMLMIEGNLSQIKAKSSQISSTKQSISTTKQSIEMFEQALAEDPNAPIQAQIVQHKEKLEKIDSQLLTLTSELINPVQMRQALIELLALESGVSLASFEVIAPVELIASPMVQNKADKTAIENKAVTEQNKIGLYRHGIKLSLKGRYAALQDYLLRLEQLKWKFFWQDFELKVTKYPSNELSVTLYSLSTKREFIGV